MEIKQIKCNNGIYRTLIVVLYQEVMENYNK